MRLFSVRTLVIGTAWLATTMVALVTGAYGHKYRANIRALIASVQVDPPIPTNLYTLRVEKLLVETEGRDGGIAQLGDGILLANRFGKLWFVDAEKAVHPLSPVIPINVHEFQDDTFNANTLYPELFAVKDLAVQNISGGIRILASHSHWHTEERCNTLRVSSLETTESALSSEDGPWEWRTLYETSPCRPLERSGLEGQRMGLGIGGRLAPLPDGSVLLTVGGFDPENELVLEAPQKMDNSYGKTILIDPVSGASRVFTIGHRNPQGLAATPDGEIWLTEHGARGGDELNHLHADGNYGYPKVAYGTQYESMVWPLSTTQGRHDGFEKPIYAWTPSIGISQLVVLQQSTFPYWRGDLIVSSLNAQTLFRVRVADGRVVLAEPIPIGHRIRDVVEAADGSIVLKTDDNFLLFVTPLTAATATTPVERGSALAAGCQSCHTLTAEGGNAIGPSLWGVVGRSVASVQGFTYSDALRGASGRWTPERLRSFLADPGGFIPGTTMQLTTSFDENQLVDLVSYLQTLR
jgi:cytochrome c2